MVKTKAINEILLFAKSFKTTMEITVNYHNFYVVQIKFTIENLKVYVMGLLIEV